MKRIFVFLALMGLSIGLLAQQAAAQEQKIAVGLGGEFNGNSLVSVAGGGLLAADFALPVEAMPMAAGLTFRFHINEFETVLEPAAAFRLYLGKLIGLTQEQSHSGLFAQLDAGVSIIIDEEEYFDTVTLFSGGLRAGWRQPLGSMFYVEPFLRSGYPFIFGAGVFAGVRF